jgi:hypothetical protein
MAARRRGRGLVSNHRQTVEPTATRPVSHNPTDVPDRLGYIPEIRMAPGRASSLHRGTAPKPHSGEGFSFPRGLLPVRANHARARMTTLSRPDRVVRLERRRRCLGSCGGDSLSLTPHGVHGSRRWRRALVEVEGVERGGSQFLRRVHGGTVLIPRVNSDFQGVRSTERAMRAVCYRGTVKGMALA